tara:strand:- start:388 stop:573 length:186 start_codon:yes stop_codon:yes gene_type:complete
VAQAMPVRLRPSAPDLPFLFHMFGEEGFIKKPHSIFEISFDNAVLAFDYNLDTLVRRILGL